MNAERILLLSHTLLIEVFFCVFSSFFLSSFFLPKQTLRDVFAHLLVLHFVSVHHVFTLCVGGMHNYVSVRRLVCTV